MAVRLIREEDVRALVNMQDALKAVESALVEQGRGTGINEPRRRVHQPNGALQLMGGALSERGYWGFKAYTVTRHGAQFSVNLYDVRTGALLAIIEANLLGQLRTGAASGVATQHLARNNAGILALFGSGYQAQAQLEAMAAVRPLREVRIYSRNASRRVQFATLMRQQLSLDIRAVESPAEAVRGADIVTTITSSVDPVLDGNDLAPGTHINAAGANAAIRAELDATAIRRAQRIFVDDLEQSRIESGNLLRAYERNALSWSNVHMLADVIAGHMAGRTRDDEITLFESHGIALWDIALAADVYERATSHNRGALVALGND
jgi:ornithine cyclodeaminase/alanine dehydrogenase-like protein (mu-crystallin family)